MAAYSEDISESPRTLAPLFAERLAPLFRGSAQLAYMGLLFVSPFAWSNTLETRPFGTVFGSYTDFRIYSGDILLAATLFFWLLTLLVQFRLPRLSPRWLTAPLCGLVLLSWSSVQTSIDPRLSVYHSIRFTVLLGLVLFLLDIRPAPLWTTLGFALGLVAQSVIAIGQFATQHSLGLTQLGELRLDPSVSGISIIRVGSDRFLRAYGATDHPNLLGGFVAVGIILVLGHYLSLSGRTRWRFVLLPALGLAGLALLLSFSRAATLGLAAGTLPLAFVIILRSRTHAPELRDLALAGAVILAVLIPFIPAVQPLLAQRVGVDSSLELNPGEQRSLGERDALLASAERIFSQRPWTGVGNGALPRAMEMLDAEFPWKEYYYQPAHVVLADVAAELGIAGAAVWLSLLALPWLALFLSRRKMRVELWLAATAGALLALTVIGFFDYYPWLLVPGRFWQWGVWGLYGAAFVSSRDGIRGRSARSKRAGPG